MEQPGGHLAPVQRKASPGTAEEKKNDPVQIPGLFYTTTPQLLLVSARMAMSSVKKAGINTVYLKTAKD
jgi:hypothetical protein